jgi:alpha,alpha-trehalose phosphorylase
VISKSVFPVEPWSIRETRLNLDQLASAESLFALSNGHIGLRGNLEEGEPNGLPGSYLAGFCETGPLPYAESAYGYPESNETVVNVTNAKIIRLLVDDEPFDVRYGTLHSHERVLDLRAGVLERSVEWTSPSGATVRVHSTRLVSLTQRAVAAIEYTVEPGGANRSAVRAVRQRGASGLRGRPAVRPRPRLQAQARLPRGRGPAGRAGARDHRERPACRGGDESRCRGAAEHRHLDGAV